MTADGKKRSAKLEKLVSLAESEERRSGALTGRFRRILEASEIPATGARQLPH